jgi:hypothetical protein
MTSKEKAIELVEKFKSFEVTIIANDEQGDPIIPTGTMLTYSSKACAVLCCDLILTADLKDHFELAYWQEVKKEIELS